MKQPLTIDEVFFLQYFGIIHSEILEMLLDKFEKLLKELHFTDILRHFKKKVTRFVRQITFKTRGVANYNKMVFRS